MRKYMSEVHLLLGSGGVDGGLCDFDHHAPFSSPGPETPQPPPPPQRGVAGAGKLTLTLDYTGALRNGTDGFFRFEMQSRDDKGGKRWMGATQFEATDARKALPCWDERNYLRHDSGLPKRRLAALLGQQGTKERLRPHIHRDWGFLGKYTIQHEIQPKHGSSRQCVPNG